MMRPLPTTSQDSRIARQQDIEYIVLPEMEDMHGKSFQDYIKIIRRRKWLIISPLFIILPLIALNLATEKPKYQATATVRIERINPNVVPIEEVISTERTANSPDFYLTQYEIIKSPLIVEQVVDALRLYDQPSPVESPLMQAIKEIISLPGRAMNNVISALQTYFRRTKTVAQDMEGLEPAPASFEEQRRQNAIAQLQGSLIVKPRKGTELVDIIIKGSNPEDTAEKVNKVAEIYARQNLEDRLDASRKAIDWLKRESKEIKERIDNVEASLKDFREKNNFILQDDLRYIKDPMIDKLNTLQSSYIQTDITKEDLKIQIEEVKNLLKNRNLEEIVGIMPSSISNNNSIRSLMDRYIVLKTEYYNLSEKFKENNPRLIRLKSESDRIKDSIYVEIEKLIQSKQMEYNNIIEREKYAEKLIHRQRIKVVDIGNKFENYNALKTAIAIDKDLYNALSKRLAETVLTEALESNNIKVVRLAPIPNYPLPSGNEKKIMLSVVVALAFGAGLAVFMDSQDKRFKSVDEAERYLRVPFLGIVPSYKAGRNQPIALYNPGASASEAYRSLRTWIRLSSQNSVKALLITSANLGEGKSHTAANLAISFAQLGQRVVLIDADLRRPMLHHMFNVTNRSGLIDILAGGAEWQSVLHDTVMENLKVLPAGGRPHNPAELLSTIRMQNLLGSLKGAFDILIVDAPVTLSIPDVAILVPEMDAVLLVHCPVKGDREAVLEAKKTLDKAGANLLGVIFNNVKLKMQKCYYHSQRQYRSPYSTGIPTLQKQANVTFIDMRPTENREKWTAAAPPSHDPSNHDA